MDKVRYLTAREAAAALGVSVTTLYAYVSRGLVRSEARGGRKRDRVYYGEDIERLKVRKEARRNPEGVAARALHTGAPVLESAITLITDDCVYYRGRNALELAVAWPFERVAGLIWTGRDEAEVPGLAPPLGEKVSSGCRAVLARLAHLKPVARFQALLPVAGAEDLAAYDLRPEAVALTGARILRFLTAVAAGGTAEGGIAEVLQRTWAPAHPESVDLINAMLILYADHELNTSAFAARCAASAGATPYGAVCAGLAALQGYKHGAASQLAEALFREADVRGDVRQTVADRLRLGERIPGFGHAIYRDVDPRAKLMLDCLTERFPDSPHLALALAVIEETHRLTAVCYNIDLALATLARVLGMPEGSATALFAMGRIAGWIGHAIEQYQLDRMIRPRARYVGPQP